MSWDSSVWIEPTQRWASINDPDDTIVIERPHKNHWVARNTSGDALHLTGAQIRSTYRHSAA